MPESYRDDWRRWELGDWELGVGSRVHGDEPRGFNQASDHVPFDRRGGCQNQRLPSSAASAETSGWFHWNSAR